jgi:MFS family permease
MTTPSEPAAQRPTPRSPSLPRGLAALNHRNYRLFFAGQLVSVTGTWMQTLAQSWLVLTLTASAFRLGLVNVLQFTPILFLGLFAGVFADRFAKRSILIATQACSAMIAGTLAILDWTGRVELWQVYALALSLGIVNSFDMPARQAFVSEMVAPADLMNAIALNSSVFNAGRLVGPAIAGLLLAAYGTAICFAFNALSFLGVIGALLLMRVAKGPKRRRGAGFAQLREGLAYVKNSSSLLLIFMLVGFCASFGLNFNIWVPLLARNEFATGASGFGLLMSALGLGSLAGALSLAFFGRGPSTTRMVTTAAILGATELMLATASWLGAPIPIALLIVPVTGFAMTSTMSMANTLVQSSTPDALRGRVMSVYMTVFAGTIPFGALLAGATSTALGTPASVAIGGSVTVIAATFVAIRGGIISTPYALPATSLKEFGSLQSNSTENRN